MKKSDGFWQSLERYVYKTARRSPLPWPWIGLSVVGIVVLASLLNVKNSVVGAQDTREVVERAVGRGDYGLAKQLFEQGTENIEYRVLGAESELEDKVYPEKVVERKIAELEKRLEQYPNHFEILLEVSRLNSMIGRDDLAGEYRERARVLDPNSAKFQ